MTSKGNGMTSGDATFAAALRQVGWRDLVALSRERRWIIAELLGNLAVGSLVIALPYQMLRYPLLAMLAGQCLTAFFAVWTVHHDCAGSTPPARTIRHRLRSVITFNMFFHL